MTSVVGHVMRRCGNRADRGRGWTWEEVKKLIGDVEHMMRAQPQTSFAQGWPEMSGTGTRASMLMLTIVHAACVLDPRVACPLLRSLARLPGFDPEIRTKTGITPMIVVVYNNSPDRHKIATTLLQLGANPNSPADAKESPRGRVVQRKPALAHLFQMKKPLFDSDMLRTRRHVDTDLAKVLIEAGAHVGAAYTCRPPIQVMERNGEYDKRFKGGHCLPFNQCYPAFGSGHVWRTMPVEDERSESNRWILRLFRNHGRLPSIKARSSYSAEDTVRQVKNPGEKIKPSNLKILVDAPACPWDKRVQSEFFTTMLCLHRPETNVPVTLWPLLLSYLVTSPYAGFYDASRLEKIWKRQLSPYLDTGYVVAQAKTRTADHVICDNLAQFLLETNIEVTVNGVTLYAAVDKDKCYEFADVAAALFGTTPSMLPSSFAGVLTRRFSYGNVVHSLRESKSNEQIQHSICKSYTERFNAGSYCIYSFSLHLVNLTVERAMKKVINECRFQPNAKKAMEKLLPTQTPPLLPVDVEMVVNQWFALNPAV